MAYQKIIIDANHFKVEHQIEDKKHIVAFFTDEAQAKTLAILLDMMESTWCYRGVLDVEDKYIREYGNRATKVGLTKDYLRGIMKSEWNYLDMYFTTIPAGTDNEGISYRTIVPKEGEK